MRLHSLRAGLLLIGSFAAVFSLKAQKPADTTGKIIWGFPITSYTVPMSDTAIVVQVYLPGGAALIKDKQLGVLRGVAEGSVVDTGDKGYGRCHLIKGDYYYFAIHQKGSSKPKKGDLVYTLIPRPQGFSTSPLSRCAAHGIAFLNVDDSAFYKPSDFLRPCSKSINESLLQKMIADVKRTGNYYLTENPDMNQEITEGLYAGRKMLDVMAAASGKDLDDFMNYVNARPLRYAGNRWKISETFATWLINGAPMVIAEK